MNKKQIFKQIASYLVIVLAFLASAFFLFAQTKDFDSLLIVNDNYIKITNERPEKNIEPDYVRGIYLTAYSAQREAWRGRLIEKMKAGRINSVIIDIKDYTGHILYDSQLDILHELDTINPIVKDIKGVIEDFHEGGIYVIARLTVFEDPALARAKPEWAMKTKNGNTWYNYNGLAWTDPGNQEVWDYNIAIAREAAKLGFDEINFDYIRYPSDGNLSSIDFGLEEGETKAQSMEKFFAYLSDKLTGKVKTSADMFGLVMDNAKAGYGLGIGQTLKSAIPYFDFICPMMYASHYGSGYMGFDNPADYPAELMTYGIGLAEETFADGRATLRPWLQAFSIGAVYGQEKINGQITATENATSTTGWLLWNARNYYEDFIFE